MIDWNRVKELREEVGEDAFEEVVALFLEEVDETLAQLKPANADAAAIPDQLHFLKGSALSLGFRAMAAHCRDGETRLRNGSDFDSVELINLYHSSRESFLNGLTNQLET